jgi:peptide/nickel transport system permease protein
VTSRSFAGDTWRKFRRSPGSLTGAFIVALILAVAIFAPVVAPHDPLGQALTQQSQPPSFAHWLGTDKLGRDVFSRIV